MFRRFTSRWPGWLVGLGLGLAALWVVGPGPLGSVLENLSFDLPMVGHGTAAPEGVALVYLDDSTYRELAQPRNRPLHRGYHAQLLKVLRTAGARAVVFDLLFSDPDPDPRGDAAFLAELRLRPDTVLAMKHDVNQGSGGVFLVPTWPASNYVAAVWPRIGTSRLRLDGDIGVRRLPTAIDGVPTLAEVAAGLAGRHPAPSPRVRYLHYYGRQTLYPSIDYAGALLGRSAPGFFKDKVVFVGTRQKTAVTGSGVDMFAMPYTRAGDPAAPGALIQATAYLNLARNESLGRMAAGWENLLWLAVLGAVAVLPVVPPVRGAWLAVGSIAGLVGVGYLSARSVHVWFPWVNLSVLLGAGWAWAIAYNGVREHVANRVLAESIGKHVSPRRVRELLHRREALQPGGELLDVSVVFTDLEGFSKLSQRIPPSDLMRELNAYYEKAIGVVHAEEGTVVDLIGDAIFAIWNAPDRQPDHAERACRAALALARSVGVFSAANGGVPMRTRIGLHRGPACVGNVGSRTRFNYTAIGDAVNLASRLEGLNKALGTQILATHDIVDGLQDRLVTRFVGQFQAKGSDRVFLVHELIRERDPGSAEDPWMPVFREGMQAFQNREWDRAEERFRRVGTMRGGTDGASSDGPSRFLLRRIEILRRDPPPGDWKGEIQLDEK